MTTTETNTNPLGTERIGKLIAKFSIPSIIALIVNAIYNMVDQIFIGQAVGYLGNAATNVILPLVTILIALGVMLSDGTAAFMSLQLGAGEEKKASHGVGNCITLMIVIGVVTCILFEVFLEPLCLLFGSTETVLPYAMEYGRVIVLGFPLAMVDFAMASVIRADGKPKESMIGMLIGCFSNIILDALFCLVFDWGCAGAAWATIIGQALNAVYYIWLMFRFKTIHIVKSYFRLKGKIVRKVAVLGIPSFVTQIATVLIMFVMNNMLVSAGEKSIYGGDIPLAVMGIVMKFCTIVAAFALGIATGSQPIIGYNYGNKQYGRVKSTFKIGLVSSTIILFVAFAIFQIFPHQIVSLFGQESELYMEFAVKCMRTYLFGCFMIGAGLVSCIFFQSVGKPVPSTVLSILRQIVLLIPAIVILGNTFGVKGILFAGPFSDILSGVISLIVVACYWKKIFPAKENAEESVEVVKPSHPGAIITISREHGSSGKQIGRLVAEKLHIPFYYKETTALAAQESGLDREFISDINKNSPDYLRELYLSTNVVQNAIIAQHKVLHKIAESGSCVIVGRGADYVLRDYSEVIRVFVYAPEEYRIGRVMEVYGDTREEAERNIHRSDKARGAYYRSISGNEWGDRRHYDLLVDSSIGLEQAADVIVKYISAKVFS